jgi:hypothetical protein
MNRAGVRRRWWAAVSTTALATAMALTPSARPVAAQRDRPTITSMTPNFGPARGGAITVITATNLPPAGIDLRFPVLAA